VVAEGSDKSAARSSMVGKSEAVGSNEPDGSTAKVSRFATGLGRSTAKVDWSANAADRSEAVGSDKSAARSNAPDGSAAKVGRLATGGAIYGESGLVRECSGQI
jgi:hypothetical protein